MRLAFLVVGSNFCARFLGRLFGGERAKLRKTFWMNQYAYILPIINNIYIYTWNLCSIICTWNYVYI